MIRRCCLSACVFLVLTSRTLGWWGTGHAYITQNAPQHLPTLLQTFVNRNFPTISSYATNEPPGLHFIDIDVYPEFFAGQMPRDLNVLYAQYGAAYVNAQGTSPWTIKNYRATLTALMSTARELSDLQLVASTAGEMAHYLEDINQPLHTTQNYNGQFTGNSGIHARYEGEMIERHFADLAIAQAPQNCVYVSDTVDWVLDSIETRTWAHVADIMSADTLARTFGSVTSNAYYNSLWSSTGAFTHSQFQYATEMVASAWYSAWVDAGSPALSISGDYNNDGTVNNADYVVWRKNLNTAAHLPNDLTPGVNASDLAEWRLHYGQTLFGGSGTVLENAVPEPTAMFLLVAFIALAGINHRSFIRS